jgi:hypothetical protein
MCSTQQTYLHSIVCGQEFRIIAGQPHRKGVALNKPIYTVLSVVKNSVL